MRRTRHTEEKPTKQPLSFLTKMMIGALVAIYLVTLVEYASSQSQISHLEERINTLERSGRILEDTQNRMLTTSERATIRHYQRNLR